MLLVAAAMAGCHHARVAYRARVLDQAMPAMPVAPLPPATPQAVVPNVQPALPATPQPVLPSTPQPVVPPLSSTGVVLEKIGPSQASVGALITYRIEVQAANGGARDVTVLDQLAPGLTFVSSTPAAALSSGQLEWRLGDMRSGELRTIEANFRAEQAGTFNNCAVARTADGQTSQDCVSTAVLAPDLEVRVSVVGSDAIMVGQQVTFEITVTNRSSLPATGLVVCSRFDAGLEHAAAASPIEKDLGQLLAGQSQTFGVTFRATQPGRLCNRVEVRGDGGIRGEAEACVTVMMAAPPAQPPQTPVQPSTPATPQPQVPAQPSPPVTPPTPAEPRPQQAQGSLQIKVTGPAGVQKVGAVAEFFIDVTNTGQAALEQVTIKTTLDSALNPVQATDGYEWDDQDRLYWEFPSLAAGKSLRLQLNCRCESPAARACVAAAASAPQAAVAEGEACVEIRRGESKLSMSVIDLADPVAVGKEVTYEVRVTNEGTDIERNVALLVIVPAEMSIVHLGTMVVGERTTYGIDGQNVRFKPVAQLPPGDKLTFRVRARANRPGDVKLEAILSSDGTPQPMTVTQQTTVVE